ncbi:MAG: signal peptidase I [Muribaculaceae bacterium]
MTVSERNILNVICYGIVVVWVYYIAWYSVRIFLFDRFVIPTESMDPTLLPGDCIIVDKTIFGARLYEKFDFNKEGGELVCRRTRGERRIMPNDIVVFNYPYHNDKINFVVNNVYTKRCIGTPGDTVRITDGVFRNSNFPDTIGLLHLQKKLAAIPDSMFHPRQLGAIPRTRHVPWTIKNLGPLYLPRKGDFMKLTAKEGQIYKTILEWETAKSISIDWDNNKVFADSKPLDRHTFRHGYYFMCGDNVAGSEDSRYWGLVPEEYIVGVVTYIAYSLDPSTGKYRKDRFFERLAQ